LIARLKGVRGCKTAAKTMKKISTVQASSPVVQMAQSAGLCQDAVGSRPGPLKVMSPPLRSGY
jgi:hypothetical protein